MPTASPQTIVYETPRLCRSLSSTACLVTRVSDLRNARVVHGTVDGWLSSACPRVDLRPLLKDGYRGALLLGAGIVVAAALAAGALRFRFPHQLGALYQSARSPRGTAGVAR